MQNSSTSKVRNSRRVNPSSSRVFGAGSSVSNSSRQIGQTSGLGGSRGHNSQSTQIYLDGVNVTPQSLLIPYSNFSTKNTKKKSAKISSSANQNTSKNSSKSTNIAKSKEVEHTPTEDVEAFEPKKDADIQEAVSVKTNPATKAITPAADDPAKAAPDLSSLEAPITVQLRETPTHMLFELQSVCVAQDTPQHQLISKRNERYMELCNSKNRSDSFTVRHTQTLNFAQKNKEVMATPPATRDVGCNATSWDIYDCNENDDDAMGHELEDNHTQAANNNGNSSNISYNKSDNYFTTHVEEIVAASLASPGCLLDVEGDIVQELKFLQNFQRKKGEKKKKHDHGGRSTNSSGIQRSSKNNYINSQSNMNTTSNINPVSSSNNLIGKSGDLSSSDYAGNSSSNAMNFSHGSSDDGTEQREQILQVDINEIIADQKKDRIMSSEDLVRNLSWIERAVQQNIYHCRHLKYRNFPSISMNGSSADMNEKSTHEQSSFSANLNDESSNGISGEHNTDLVDTLSASVTLERLWGFHCSITEGRTISCMEWNPLNKDLLAVSYGEYEFTSQKGGLVLFWSLKNPEYPERTYQMKTGVTCLSFSAVHANLLAVGFYNGIVSIYDTRKDDEKPILESGQSSESHMDAVWQLKWVPKGKGSGRRESLVSIAGDGRVTEWSMKKGLSSVDLMILKRVANPLNQTIHPSTTNSNSSNTSAAVRSEGIISRQSGGYCIDFAGNDSSVYFAGTEDGNIHKCSSSYNEQYLETYFGHTGPIYGIQISPFWPEVFLSCSADWTVKLWTQSETEPVLSFHSVDLDQAAHSISWSPSVSTVFGSVTEDGRVEIWDLEQSTLDPILTYFPQSENTCEPAEGSSALLDDQEDVNNGDVKEKGTSKNIKEEIIKKRYQCTQILFALDSPVLVIGDNNGVVSVFRVPSLAKKQQNIVDQVQQLKNAIYPKNEIEEESGTSAVSSSNANFKGTMPNNDSPSNKLSHNASYVDISDS